MFEEAGRRYASDLEMIYKKGVLDGYSKAEKRLEYAKTIIQDLLDNSDENARQRAMDFLEQRAMDFLEE